MAVTATFSPSTGILAVIGNDSDNTLTVSRNAAGALLVNGGAVVIRGGPPTVANTALVQVFGRAATTSSGWTRPTGRCRKPTCSAARATIRSLVAPVWDLLFGEAGVDTLLGQGGNDQLFGGADNDTLTGGDADDQVFGEAGDDRIIWNPGDDTGSQ